MITRRSPKWMAMTASLRVPSISGTAWKPGAAMTVKPGRKASASPGAQSCRNRARANRLCHARSLMTRTGRR